MTVIAWAERPTTAEQILHLTSIPRVPDHPPTPVDLPALAWVPAPRLLVDLHRFGRRGRTVCGITTVHYGQTVTGAQARELLSVPCGLCWAVAP